MVHNYIIAQTVVKLQPYQDPRMRVVGVSVKKKISELNHFSGLQDLMGSGVFQL